jgi:hypothetical protein
MRHSKLTAALSCLMPLAALLLVTAVGGCVGYSSQPTRDYGYTRDYNYRYHRGYYAQYPNSYAYPNSYTYSYNYRPYYSPDYNGAYNTYEYGGGAGR